MPAEVSKPVVIQHAVWLYLRFTLSYRDVEELLAERGLDLSYESVRSGCSNSDWQSLGACDGAVLDRAIGGISTKVRRERTTSNGSAELHRR